MKDRSEVCTPGENLSINTNAEKELFEKINWEGGVNTLCELSEHGLPLDWTRYWVPLASEMCKFDPKRFNEDIEITDNLWQNFYQDVNDRVKNFHLLSGSEAREYHTNMREFLELAAPLKELDSERFSLNINLGDDHWVKIAEWIKNLSPLLFIEYYEKAYTIDAQKITKLLPIKKQDWSFFREVIRTAPLPDWTSAIGAQNIKPEGFSDMTIPKEELGDLRIIVSRWIREGSHESIVFKYARLLRDKAIKVEEIS